MSIHYQAVGWNRQKRWIDGLALAGVLLILGAFAAATRLHSPATTLETILIRGLAATAFLLLTLVLSIGPLCRLDRRFLPLLYNRRHLGVLTFLLGMAHAAFATLQYHGSGNLDPLTSVLTAYRAGPGLSPFPFELFGVGALGILFLLAATSHDFWLSVLTPPIWKSLHMMAYVAYGLLVAHIAFGVLQAETHPVLAGLTAVGLVVVGGLHLLAARREAPRDRPGAVTEGGWIDVGAARDIPEGRALVASVAGERVAVFRHEGRLSCVSNVCKHQNGPLGEGRIIGGCITCPWHGYQYYPDSGRSPPPYEDTIPTFTLRVVQGRILVGERPNPPGTPVPPVPVEEAPVV